MGLGRCEPGWSGEEGVAFRFGGLSVSPLLACGGAGGGLLSLMLHWPCLCLRPQEGVAVASEGYLLQGSCWEGEQPGGLSHHVSSVGAAGVRASAWAAQRSLLRGAYGTTVMMRGAGGWGSDRYFKTFYHRALQTHIKVDRTI